MENLLIQIANDNHIKSLSEFNKLMAKETEDIDLDFEKVKSGVSFLIENPHNGFYLIALLNDELIGSLMITKEWSDWRNGFFWWIQSVYVKPEFRRKGVYSSLYQHIKEISKKDNKCVGYRLYVEKENISAIETYKKSGMSETYYKLFEEIK